MKGPPAHGDAALALAPTTLTGVGPARAAALARLGISSVGALLALVPRRLEHSGVRCSTRVAVLRAAGAEENAAPDSEGEVSVVGTLRGLRLFRAGRRRTVLSLDVVDESGALRALFFNQPWLFERLRALAAAGTRVELSGRIGATKQGPALLAPRLVEDPPAERTPRLVPVYPTSAGLGQELLRRLVAEALARHGAHVRERLAPALLEQHALPRLEQALQGLHAPASRAEFEGARRRLALERLLGLQARLARAGERNAAAHARRVTLDARAREELRARLPFTPTAGQRRVLDEILDDLARTRPMRRLLQGDVGSGKTLVAMAACAAVARAGGQAALLVPTELLGEQHHIGLARALERLGVRAVRLAGSQRAAERRAALEELERGQAQLAIGTHALLSPAVTFARLDLVVIDEQQRFGVAQKRALLEKGADVHALLMSATPIPRTLALCYYGDLETSLLTERPPGRGTLVTSVAGEARRAEIEAFAAARTQQGERVFWVCPRIVDPEEDAPKEDAPDEERESRAETASAERAHEHLARGPLAARGLGLLHGRLSPERRQRAIEDFRRGAIHTLVATSMVEVGVDVPEATVMVIDGAVRFGLAQLHQLRGRVGRSSLPAYCFLMASGEGAERLAFLEGCDDGFVLAEEDLRRRGMGDLAGLRQAGENSEGLAGLDQDLALVRAARELVRTDAALYAHYLGVAAGAALV